MSWATGEPIPLRVNLLGPLSVSLGTRSAGPWERPVAKRLFGLVMTSPGRRISRGTACQVLFGDLASGEAGRRLSKALSMARAALAPLGEPGRDLFQADRSHIWARPGYPIEVDWDVQESLLRAAIDAQPGNERDELFALALANEGPLLEDEPTADWAYQLRERLEWERQEARLTLARDRARGFGRCRPAEVVGAWEACLAHDPACEEAACALMKLYRAQGKHTLVVTTYRRCRSALEQLGLRSSPALDEIYADRPGAERSAGAREDGERSSVPTRLGGERRLVSVLFAELSTVGGSHRSDPEDFRDIVGEAVVGLISEVERLGGTVTSVSGAGLAALFGAPVAHEDDPERVVRAVFRMLSSLEGHTRLSLRAGVETGPAIVGPIGGPARLDYGAVGEVVGVAAALQSVARPASALVGPATRAATEGLFKWGPVEEVPVSAGAKPVRASYLERPRAHPVGQAGRRGLAGSAPLMGRQDEMSALRDALREITGGKGGLILVAGDPGLGKTRLVQECRRLFMAWVGGASGRLPLWLEGRSASYESSNPYGLYQQLLAAWVGVAPDEKSDRVKAALDRALRAVFAGEHDEERASLLSQVMGLGAGGATAAAGRLSPEQLQRATFAAFRALLAKLVTHGPTVLVLEDLHWADPTSLHLTAEIASLTQNGPLLLVLTRRPEPDPGVSALEEALATRADIVMRRLTLTPLAEEPARALASALVGQGPAEEVISAVTHGTEGNPLYMEEQLFSLVETGALTKGPEGWRLSAGPSGDVPEALERLVRSRVDRLDPASRDTMVAASVLGPDFSLGALRTVTDPDGGLAGAVSALCSGGLLLELRRHPEPVYRFRHAVIQESTYRGLLREQRRQLHARAAWGLEEQATGRLEEMASVLGHHFAMAGENGRAAHYLEMAGDRAAAAFANDETIASYRRALGLLSEESRPEVMLGQGASRLSELRLSELRAKLAEVYVRSGRYAEGRQVVTEGLAAVHAENAFGAARLQALLGRLEIADHNHQAALSAFDAAVSILGDDPADLDQETLDLWLEVQVDGRVYLYYWLNQPDKAAAILARAGPVIEARGSPRRQAHFYMNRAMQRARVTRYDVDDQMLTDMKKAVTLARERLAEPDVAFLTFGTGFLLLWHGDLEEARDELQRSLAMTEHTGDVVLRARCLCYLDVTALRLHDTEVVRSTAPLALEAAETANYPEYIAAAKAHMAWVAWQDGREQDVLALANEALALWATTVVSYSWFWICLWPLISVHLAQGQVPYAVEAARQLLAPPQQRLPERLESLVRSAIADWEGSRHHRVRAQLSEAVEVARELRYT